MAFSRVNALKDGAAADDYCVTGASGPKETKARAYPFFHTSTKTETMKQLVLFAFG